jgi:hypothetical protein
MLSRLSPGINRSIRSNSASAARVRAAAVGSGRGRRGVEGAGGAFVALDALNLAGSEEFTSTDCPEARMAGGNNNNNRLR